MIGQTAKITTMNPSQDENFEGLPPRIRDLLTNASEALPILRQSRVDILNRTTDDKANASDISEVIMRDQALTTKILKLVNSPAYHTRTPVATVTQAVTLLGFDVIRSATIVAQLIEQAEAGGGQSVALKRLLARALLSATEALELGTAIGYPNSGHLFTSAMLYTLGDLVLAHYLPDLYQQLECCRQTDPGHLPALEVELLGLPLYRFAVVVSRQWNLPDFIVEIIEANPKLSGKRLNTHRDQFDGLVCSANDLVRVLVDPYTQATEVTLGRLVQKMATAFDISPVMVRTITAKAFEKASHFSEAVNLDHAYFLPDIGWKNSQADSLLHGLVKTIWKTIGSPSTSSSTSTPSRSTSSPLPETPESSRESMVPNIWTFLQDFSLRSLTTLNPNTLLNLAAEGLNSGGGFERVVLVLVIPGTGTLEARVGYGTNIERFLPLFGLAMNENHLLIKSLNQGEPMKIESMRAEMLADRIPSAFVEEWGERDCLLGPFSVRGKPIGMIIADHGGDGRLLSPEDFSAFVLVIGQVNVNLSRLAQKANSATT